MSVLVFTKVDVTVVKLKHYRDEVSYRKIRKWVTLAQWCVVAVQHDVIIEPSVIWCIIKRLS